MKDTHNGTRAQQQVQSDDLPRRHSPLPAPERRHRPAKFSQLHGLGGHRPSVDDGGRRANVKTLCRHRRRSGTHPQPRAGFSFVQISDSHIGFNKAANQDVTGTLKLALDKINACQPRRTCCCTPAISATHPSRRSSTPRSSSSKVSRPGKPSMFRASTIPHPTMAFSIANASARARWAAAGTALPIKACTSSGSIILCRSMPWANWGPNSLHG